MEQDLVVRGLSVNTQRAYLYVVSDLTRYHRRSPDALGDREVQRYVRHLIEERRLAWGSLRAMVSGLRFFYWTTLDASAFERHRLEANADPRRARQGTQGSLHAALAGEQSWSAWLQQLRTKDWVVYAKAPFGGPQRVLKYLSRYTHRSAIANHRLVTIEDGIVRFRWRDYAHHNQVKVMALPADEFLRRFLLHVVPSGFMRIRHFGLLANRHRAVKLARSRQLLVPTPEGGRCVRRRYLIGRT
jgi:hypothetical protein